MAEAVPELVPAKKWYASKTLWVNAISVIGLIVMQFTGVEINAEATGGIIALVNIVLRVITKEGLTA